MTEVHWQAALFDLDGVITDTADVHMQAWKQLFDDYLQRRCQNTGETFRAFDRSDYLKFVDGKPRLDGIRCFLQSRGIQLDQENAENGQITDTVHSLGELKNQLFLETLEREGVPVFDSSVQWIQAIRQVGIATAVASSSRNCEHILKLAGLTQLFDKRVDGITLAEQGLPGKPAPDLFLSACSALAIPPARSAVFEDAIAGVQAGRAGHFGLVVGIARRQSKQTLLENGADIAVTDLSELPLERINDWFSQHKSRASLGT